MALQMAARSAVQMNLLDLYRHIELACFAPEIVGGRDDTLETGVEKSGMKEIILCRERIRQMNFAQRFAIASATALDTLKEWSIVQADFVTKLVAILSRELQTCSASEGALAGAAGW